MTRSEARGARFRRRRVVPEVVQSSAMDCGPAALKSLLEGFGIRTSYGRLREACQTEIDGTSIDTLEQVACQLGLDAEQVMVPTDHLLLKEADLLPALVVVRLPTGGTHFVVVWSCHGPLIQVMDPATGRRWQRRASVLRDLFIHRFPVPADAWLEYAASDDFQRPLGALLQTLGLSASAAEILRSEAVSHETWYPVAALDAAARMVGALIESGGLKRGNEAEHLLRNVLTTTLGERPGDDHTIPGGFWSVRPAAGGDDENQELLELRGVVLIRCRGVAERGATAEDDAPSPALVARAVRSREERPFRALLRAIGNGGWGLPLAALAGVGLSAAVVMIEALLYRGMLDLGRWLGLPEQRLGATIAVAAILLGLLTLAIPVMASFLRIGRHLEIGLRMAFLEKIPRLGDRYFHSRLSSDMAERAHVLHLIRMFPSHLAQIWRSICLLGATTAGIIWLDPGAAPIAVTSALLAVVIPLLGQHVMLERDLRVRSHGGALTRFFLDALLGLTAVRCHSAARALRTEHEMLLVEWARAQLGLLRAAVSVEGLSAFSGYALAIWLLFDHLARAGESGMVLLLAYWVLSMPDIGGELSAAVRLLPSHRNIAIRLLEPLEAPDDAVPVRGEPTSPHGAPEAVSITMTDVTVHAGGHPILEHITLSIAAGSHVAIVGPSGAGKSSLVGLLLGWHHPSEGSISVDGRKLDGIALQQLRRRTAWVDPAVRLWNHSFVDNLEYGANDGAQRALSHALHGADLYGVVERLPDGMQTHLGEGGGLLSGGEGQRVRLGRALHRGEVGLAILDEPFRGLDRRQREKLLIASRQHWAGATLLCITHDIRETRGFERVIVVDRGRIVEDGSTDLLAADPDSRYSRLLTADEAVDHELWGSAQWRRLEVVDGRFVENGREGDR